MANTITVDIVDKSVPSMNHKQIAIIGKPNPVTGEPVTGEQLIQLIQFPQYWITETGTGNVINGGNIYDYFPELRPGGGGSVDPSDVEDIVRSMTDTFISTTSTNPIANSTITNFVNSSIESSTAEFKGTFSSKQAMDAVIANKNDYAFLIVYNDDNPQTVNHYERYKWSEQEVSGSHWLYEYDLNNSSFTAEQWAAINSGVKDTDVTKLSNLKPVATSGDYDDLTNKPTLGTAAAQDIEAFASASQGTKADNAIPGLSSGTTENDIVVFGINGKTVKDIGVAVETSFTDSDAKIPTSKSIKTNVSKNAVLTDYQIKSTGSAIQTTDTINDAIGKLEAYIGDVNAVLEEVL